MVNELVQDFAKTLDVMPQDHCRRRILSLLGESLVHDQHFIERHPAALFQCLWNRCWWYDSPETASYIDHEQTYWPPPGPPWEQDGPRLYQLMDDVRKKKEGYAPGHRWLRALRPPEIMLGSGQRRIYEGHSRSVTAIANYHHAERIVSSAKDGTIRIWNTETGQEVSCLTGHQDEVSGVVVTPDDKWIISSSYDGTIRVWNAQSLEPMLILHNAGESSRPMTSIACSRDGKWVVAGSFDGQVRVWSLEDWSLLPDNEDREAVRSTVWCVGFSLDSQRVFRGTRNFTQAIEIESRRCLFTQRSARQGVNCLSFSLDGAYGASCGSRSHFAHTWQVSNGRPLRTFSGHTSPISVCAFGLDSQRFFTGAYDNTVRTWDTVSGQQLSVVNLPGAPTCMTIAAKGKSLLCGMADGHIREIAISDDVPRPQLDTHLVEITDVAFSADGNLIATTAIESVVRIWNGRNGKPVHRLLGHNFDCNLAKFAPDGRLLLTRTRSPHSYRLWDGQSGTPLSLFSLPAEVTISGFQRIGTHLLGVIDESPHDEQQSDEPLPAATRKSELRCALDPFTGNVTENPTAQSLVALYDSDQDAANKSFLASSAENETALISTTTREVVGWYPAVPNCCGSVTKWATPTTGTIWAGASGRHLHLFCLEGPGAEKLPVRLPEEETEDQLPHAWTDRISLVHFLIAQRGAGPLPVVIEQLIHGDLSTQTAAIYSLHRTKLSSRDIDRISNQLSVSMLDYRGPESDGLLYGRVVMQEFLARLGGRILPLVMSGLTDPDPGRRNASISLLAAMGPPAKSAVPTVLKMLLDEELDRKEALDMLSRAGMDATMSVATLSNALRLDYDWKTERSLHEAFDTVRTEAWEALLQMAEDGPITVLEPILPIITRGVNWGFAQHRKIAIKILALMGPMADCAVPELRTALSSEDPVMRGHSAWALSRILPDQQRDYVETVLLNHGDQKFRNASAQYFACDGQNSTVALPVLARLINDDEDDLVRYYAAMALGNVNPDSAGMAISHLTQVTEDRNPHVRQAAGQAITKLQALTIPPNRSVIATLELGDDPFDNAGDDSDLSEREKVEDSSSLELDDSEWMTCIDELDLPEVDSLGADTSVSNAMVARNTRDTELKRGPVASSNSTPLANSTPVRPHWATNPRRVAELQKYFREVHQHWSSISSRVPFWIRSKSTPMTPSCDTLEINPVVMQAHVASYATQCQKWLALSWWQQQITAPPRLPSVRDMETESANKSIT